MGLKTAKIDNEWIETVYDAYRTEIYRYCLSIVKNRELAEDSFQDTF